MILPTNARKINRRVTALSQLLKGIATSRKKQTFDGCLRIMRGGIFTKLMDF